MPNSASLVFNGTSAYASAADHADLDITGSWTLELWVKNTAANWNSGGNWIVGKGHTDTSSANFVFWYEFNDIYAGFQDSGFNNWRVQYGVSGVSLNAWHHWAAVFDTTANTITLYLDGSQAAQATSMTGTPAANSDAFVLAKHP